MKQQKSRHREQHAPQSRRRPIVLGWRAFARISAVEGIVPSPALRDDLCALAEASAEHRRSVLARKYGRQRD